MKKSLVLMALASGTLVSLTYGKTTEELAKDVNELITFTENYGSKWSDLMGDMHKAKYDLEKKHKIERMNLAKNKITELGKTKDVDAYLSSKRADMLALHKKQLQEWQAFSKAWSDKKQAQGENESVELAAFEEVEETPEDQE